MPHGWMMVEAVIQNRKHQFMLSQTLLCFCHVVRSGTGVKLLLIATYLGQSTCRNAAFQYSGDEVRFVRHVHMRQMSPPD